MTRFQNTSVASFVREHPPKNWHVTPAKRFCIEVDQRSESGKEELLGLSKSTGVRRKSDMDQRASQAENYAGYKKVAKGDLVSNKMQAWNGMFGISPYDGITSPDYAIYRLAKSVESKFIEYVCRTELYSMEFHSKSRGMGTGFLRLNQSDFLSTPFFLPDLETQRQIAVFLDRETARIDLLIEKKQSLVKLLSEKYALLRKAIATGSTQQMNSDGLRHNEWIGSYKNSWVLCKAKHVAKVLVPQRTKPTLNTEIGLPWITADYLNDDEVMNGSTRYSVSAPAVVEAGSTVFPADTVLATCVGTFGNASIARSENIPNQQIHGFLCTTRILPEYLLEIVKFSGSFFEANCTTTTIKYVNRTGFENMPVLLPTITEQKEIIREIGQLKTLEKSLKRSVMNSIDRLKEYRSALITAAVTGQIDVASHSKSDVTERGIDALQDEMDA